MSDYVVSSAPHKMALAEPSFMSVVTEYTPYDEETDDDDDETEEEDDDESTDSECSVPTIPGDIEICPEPEMKSSKPYKYDQVPTSTRIDLDEAVCHLNKMEKLLPNAPPPPVITKIPSTESRNTLPPLTKEMRKKNRGIDSTLLNKLKNTLTKKDIQVLYKSMHGKSMPDVVEEKEESREDRHDSSSKDEEERDAPAQQTDSWPESSVDSTLPSFLAACESVQDNNEATRIENETPIAPKPTEFAKVENETPIAPKPKKRSLLRMFSKKKSKSQIVDVSADVIKQQEPQIIQENCLKNGEESSQRCSLSESVTSSSKAKSDENDAMVGVDKIAKSTVESAIEGATPGATVDAMDSMAKSVKDSMATKDYVSKPIKSNVKDDNNEATVADNKEATEAVLSPAATKTQPQKLGHNSKPEMKKSGSKKPNAVSLGLKKGSRARSATRSSFIDVSKSGARKKVGTEKEATMTGNASKSPYKRSNSAGRKILRSPLRARSRSQNVGQKRDNAPKKMPKAENSNRRRATKASNNNDSVLLDHAPSPKAPSSKAPRKSCRSKESTPVSDFAPISAELKDLDQLLESKNKSRDAESTTSKSVVKEGRSVGSNKDTASISSKKSNASKSRVGDWERVFLDDVESFDEFQGVVEDVTESLKIFKCTEFRTENGLPEAYYYMNMIEQSFFRMSNLFGGTVAVANCNGEDDTFHDIINLESPGKITSRTCDDDSLLGNPRMETDKSTTKSIRSKSAKSTRGETWSRRSKKSTRAKVAETRSKSSKRTMKTKETEKKPQSTDGSSLKQTKDGCSLTPSKHQKQAARSVKAKPVPSKSHRSEHDHPGTRLNLDSTKDVMDQQVKSRARHTSEC